MRAFIAGATGYTGRALARVLQARGAEVTAHVRPGSRVSPGFGAVDQTPWDEAAMRTTLTALQPTHVFALLGTTRKRMQRDAVSTYEAVDYGLTSLLLRASPPGARFIYLSALGASETTGNEYLRVRGRIERELRESGRSWIAARPAFVTGPDREESRPLERAGAIVTDGLLHALAKVGVRGPLEKYGSMTGDELARGLAAAAESGRDGVWEVAALRRAARSAAA